MKSGTPLSEHGSTGCTSACSTTPICLPTMISARLNMLLSKSSLNSAIFSTIYAQRQLRNAYWKAFAPNPLPGSETFSAQSSLPKLPVPNLEDNLACLKESLKPIAWTEEEYAAVEAKIDSFGSGLGPELQNRLMKRHAETDHWLEEWWDDEVYLGYRDSTLLPACRERIILLQVAFPARVQVHFDDLIFTEDGFDDRPFHLIQTPAARAAALARSALLFRRKFKQGVEYSLPATALVFLSLNFIRLRWMFDCCRIPSSDGLDWSNSFAVEGDTGDSAHIIVTRKNRVWKIDAAANGRLLGTNELESQIQHTPLAYIPESDYAKLASSRHNREILDAIHSSAFVISLEEGAPTSPEQRSRFLWHGEISNGQAVGLQNRWMDKPCQFIVYDSMYAGFMGEHSVLDGTTTTRLCDEVLDDIASPSFNHGDGTSSESSRTPVPLDWELSPAISQSIITANAAAIDLINSQILSFHLTSYGKDEIKKFGVSPDFWAQMIVQLAYQRTMGGKRKGGTYESATTRKFYKGGRKPLEWSAPSRTRGSKAARKALFDLAARKHINFAKLCRDGQGIDGHLLGLKKSVAETEQVPALFSDSVFTRSSHWVLSTSAIFSKHFKEYGWGEAAPEFAVAYMTGYHDRIMYTLTSRTDMPNSKFIAEIAQAARDLYGLHKGVSAEIGEARM
ncbi:hypothetical protein D9757_007296 [Collybiopsis confluens]|uniref:Choline/carnitine acyltransferase domain-containing protein n=1 Tax=Collybiopsis confluens TaxID=2823264 RepID=A0A8H5HGM9_9AGAR|nr:hypothetical protein D9757_007296 [Collybiopsis confluens]